MTSRFLQLPINNLRNDTQDASFTDDEFQEGEDSDVDLQDVLAEIREHDITGHIHDTQQEVFPSQTDAVDDPYSALENALDQIKENENVHTHGCANCSKQRRATHVSSFEKGQHILMPGQFSTYYVRTKKKLKNMYSHHAIIKEIQSTNGTLITMVLINFTYINGKFGVFEETKEFDLRTNDICIVDYIYPRHEKERIVARAESILSQKEKFKQYNPFTSNCEHFATWCVVGEGESFQVQSIRQKIMNAAARIFGVGTRIWKVVLRLFFISSDEIAVSLRTALPEIVLGASGFMYFLYCLLNTALIFRDYHKDRMCKSCLKGKLADLWMTFGAFGMTSALTYIVMHFAVAAIPGVGIPLLILLILLSVAFQIAVPKLRKALCSPFTIDRVKVTKLGQISIGDVISQNYHGIKHTGIVTEIKISNREETKGYISLVHYGSSGLFKKKIIVEELFNVDVETSTIELFDCEPLSTFPANVVVSRARSRIGETKWEVFSNRSDHFAYWAKVQPSENILTDNSCNTEIRRPLSKEKASLFIDTREIHQMDDLKIGDVVKSGVIGMIDNIGILSSVRYLDSSGGRQFEIELFTYNFSLQVTRKTYTIDLNKDRLYVKVYSSALCYSMEQRLQNARDLEDEKGTWWTTEGFIENCIEMKYEDRVKVSSLKQIAVGDVIIQRFRGFKYTSHTSIVTQVNNSKVTKSKGCIRVIHYWSSALLGTNEVVEENVEFDLAKSNVYIFVRRAPVFPPEVVVNRARSRIGETKWNMFSNRSDHFAYWAKYEQYENKNFDDNGDEEVVTSIPKTEIMQFMEKREIHHIDDLTIGDVVKSRVIGKIDNTGILSSVRSVAGSNGRKFEIEVYTYTFSRRVSCRNYIVDLKRDRMYMKLYGPRQCLSMEQRVVNAQKMTVDTGGWLTTEGFIEHCLGIKTLGRIKVTSLDQIGIGDVILQRMYGIKHTRHTSIVIGVAVLNEKQTKGCIRHIHYASSLFGTKEIVEEDITVDLEKSDIYLLHSKKTSYPADIVVSRARLRIGETKWDMLSNRSYHFANWAKFQYNENKIFDESFDENGRQLYSRTNASSLTKTREIHRIEDIKIGDVVKSNIIGNIDDTGIISSVKECCGSNGRKFDIEVYTYAFSRKVSCKKFTIDLQKDRLYVKAYNPTYCHSMERRLQNAKDMKDNKGWWWTTGGFIEHCVQIKNTKSGKVTSLDQVEKGDIISQRIHGMKFTKHTSVVIAVKIRNAKKTRGSIRVVHYGVGTLFHTREIVEEELEVDIEKSVIHLVYENTPSFQSDVVISRARSRIGETKWDLFSNRSYHFAYWAKYQQYEVEIVDETFNESINTSHQILNASRCKEKKEIHHIKDLKIGDVVKSDVIGIIDNTGLLSSVRYLDAPDGRKFEIEVFTYTYSWRITRKKYTIDLNKVRLYVDIYGPGINLSMEQRLQNAREKEDQRGSWWTTNGFIEHCLDINSENGQKITSLEQIGIGDVISQPIQGTRLTRHTSIVTGINMRTDDKTKGCINLIHYGSSALFDTRQIIEEMVEVDLEKSYICLLHCKTATFPPEMVVSRARSRIGEKKWNFFSNRSADFAYWAKFQKFEDEIVDETCNEDYIKSTSRLDVPFFKKMREIHRMKDVRIGDVVKSGVIGVINDTGILSSITPLDGPNGRKFEIEVFTYSFFWTINRKKRIIDLDENRLFVEVYNPSKCKAFEQRVQTARELEDEGGPWWTTEGFIRHCIELKSE